MIIWIINVLLSGYLASYILYVENKYLNKAYIKKKKRLSILLGAILVIFFAFIFIKFDLSEYLMRIPFIDYVILYIILCILILLPICLLIQFIINLIKKLIFLVKNKNNLKKMWNVYEHYMMQKPIAWLFLHMVILIPLFLISTIILYLFFHLSKYSILNAIIEFLSLVTVAVASFFLGFIILNLENKYINREFIQKNKISLILVGLILSIVFICIFDQLKLSTCLVNLPLIPSITKFLLFFAMCALPYIYLIKLIFFLQRKIKSANINLEMSTEVSRDN